MHKAISLAGPGWVLLSGAGEVLCPAEVPGSVYGALLAAGQIEDPYWRSNEDEAFALSWNDYGFTRRFTADAALLASPAVALCCDGLDTLATLRLNGQEIGRADNMHRRWRFDVKGCLREGENTLEVLFASPLRYIKEQNARLPLDGSHECTAGFPHLRKAHCMFGWDWGPRLPDMGIWRDIRLEAYELRLADVHCRQRHEEGRVTLAVAAQLEGADGRACALPAGCRLEILATAPDGSRFEAGEDGCIEIASPKLWWPRGLGGQPLYTLSVALYRGAELLSRWEKRIGLRTMAVRREPDEAGEGFCHVVNGVPVFAMGADYIPEDCLQGRCTPERTRRLLEDAALANMNTVRVWGGGTYPADFFFDICDELGLLVWQDFMFACAMYSLSPAFEANIAAELEDNIKRIRHHASLALWCGNNEMEWQVQERVWEYTPRQYGDYIRMYEALFPKLVERFDPDTFYWPASPSSGGSFDEPNDPNRGDVHFWEVWHDDKPFTEYRKHKFRYVSEFGFQAFPGPATVAAFTLPEDRNIFSYVMEKHQRNAAANGKIMNYLYQYFLYPTAFNSLLYASQLLQAEAVRYGVEHWRRNRGVCMGTVYWQLNDCWPVASWASIDYFGRWKALQYYAKRFFAPVLLSCAEEGFLTQGNALNQEPFAMAQTATLCLNNETPQPVAGRVCWQLRSADASVLQSGEEALRVPAFTAHWLNTLDFSDCDGRRCYLSYQFVPEAGEAACTGTALFYPPKFFHFEDPRLSVTQEDGRVRVKAGAYARAVCIEDDSGDLLLEDNYFDMDAGERSIAILRGTPKALRVCSVYDIGRQAPAGQ